MPEQVASTTEVIQTQRVVPVDEMLKLATKTNKSAVQRFKDTLDTTHPIYKDRIGLWNMVGDIALDRLEDTDRKKSYLIQGLSEEDLNFDIRVKLSKFLPESPGLLAEFLGFIFQQPIQRTLPKTKGSVLQEFVDAADLDENDLTFVAEQAARLALVFGSVDAFLERSVGAKTKTPYIVLYTPENRLDWEEDPNGGFLWVKYKEVFSAKSAWDTGSVEISEYRIVRAPILNKDPKLRQKGTIIVYQVISDGKNEIIQVFDSTLQAWLQFDPDNPPKFTPTEYDFHRIPIQTLYWDRISLGIGDPWVKQIVRADIKTFLQESDLTWDIHIHAHPQTLGWLRNTEEDDAEGKGAFDRIDFSSGSAIQLDPGDEERKPENLEYMQLNTSELSLQMEAIEKTRQLVRRMAGRGPDSDKSQTWGHPESGTALSIKQNRSSKNFSTMARKLEQFEFMLAELIILETSAATEVTKETLRIGYPHRFDLRTVEDLNQHLQFAAVIGSKALITDTSKLLGALILGHGATRDRAETVESEIVEREGKLKLGLLMADGSQMPVGLSAEDMEDFQQPIGFNDLSLAMERAARINDTATLDFLREELARRLGKSKPPDIAEEDLPHALQVERLEILKAGTGGGGLRRTVEKEP